MNLTRSNKSYLDVSVCWELEDDVLASETLVDRFERGELVLEDVRVLRVKETVSIVSTRALQENRYSRARSSENTTDESIK